MPNPKKKKEYEKLLERLEKLQGESGGKAHDRATALLAVFHDAEYRVDKELATDKDVAATLDPLVNDLCLSFQELRAMLEHYPLRKQWEGGMLKKMHTDMMAAIAANKDEEEPKKARRSATVYQVEALEKEKKELQQQLLAANKQIATLQDENKKLTTELAKAEGKLDLLKEDREKAA